MDSDTNTNVHTAPMQKNNSPEYIAAAIVIAGGIVAAAILYVNMGAGNAPQAAVAPAPEQGAPAEQVNDPDSVVVDLEGYPSLGDPEAPILMVEYSDFSCSFCKRHNDETKQRIIDTYVETGLVHYVRKDLITVGTPMTAVAAHCAGDQDAYWEYHDVLYAKQSTDGSTWNQTATFVSYADELGLDTDAFRTCLSEDRYRDRVAASSREASRYGGNGTPFFLVNGNPVSGAQPLPAFEQLFNSLGVTAE